jgi:hypothetical protein
LEPLALNFSWDIILFANKDWFRSKICLKKWKDRFNLHRFKIKIFQIQDPNSWRVSY